MAPRTVLCAHNVYQQPGGEDQVFASEAALLESRGHKVIRYVEHNDRISNMNLVTLSAATVWNCGAQRRLEKLIELERPEVVHFHNIFPLISPAAYYAAGQFGAAVVQTLHNYRLICANATMFRSGSVCEECVTKRTSWSGLRHGCYRQSRLATLGVTSMVRIHSVLRTWSHRVDSYITLNEFSRDKLLEGGLAAHKTVVKPNFVDPDPGCGDGGECALFVGRLSEEKGIRTLLNAWTRLADIPLEIIGQGSITTTDSPPQVRWLGARSHEEVLAAMKRARVLIFPSLCYEMAPLTILESFATGLPVIGSNFGAMAAMIRHGRTGLLFHPGDAEDLARQVRWAFDHPEELRAMRAAARREFEEKYTAESNYKMLMSVYEMAIDNARRKRPLAS